MKPTVSMPGYVDEDSRGNGSPWMECRSTQQSSHMSEKDIKEPAHAKRSSGTSLPVVRDSHCVSQGLFTPCNAEGALSQSSDSQPSCVQGNSSHSLSTSLVPQVSVASENILLVDKTARKDSETQHIKANQCYAEEGHGGEQEAVRHFATQTSTTSLHETFNDLSELAFTTAHSKTDRHLTTSVSCGLQTDIERFPIRKTHPRQTASERHTFLANCNTENHGLALGRVECGHHICCDNLAVKDMFINTEDSSSLQLLVENKRFSQEPVLGAGDTVTAPYLENSEGPSDLSCSVGDTVLAGSDDQASRYSYEISMVGFDQFSTIESPSLDLERSTAQSEINSRGLAVAGIQTQTVNIFDMIPAHEDAHNLTTKREDFSNSSCPQIPGNIPPNFALHNSRGSADACRTSGSDQDSLQEIHIQNPVTVSMTAHVEKYKRDQSNRCVKFMTDFPEEKRCQGTDCRCQLWSSPSAAHDKKSDSGILKNMCMHYRNGLDVDDSRKSVNSGSEATYIEASNTDGEVEQNDQQEEYPIFSNQSALGQQCDSISQSCHKRYEFSPSSEQMRTAECRDHYEKRPKSVPQSTSQCEQQQQNKSSRWKRGFSTSEIQHYRHHYPFIPSSERMVQYPKQLFTVATVPDVSCRSRAETILNSRNSYEDVQNLPSCQYSLCPNQTPTSLPYKKRVMIGQDPDDPDAEWNYRHPTKKKVFEVQNRYNGRSRFHKNPTATFSSCPHVLPEQLSNQQQPQEGEDVSWHSLQWDYKIPPDRMVSSSGKSFNQQTAHCSPNLSIGNDQYRPVTPTSVPAVAVKKQENVCADFVWDYRHPPERRVSSLRRTFSNEARKYRKPVLPKYPFYLRKYKNPLLPKYSFYPNAISLPREKCSVHTDHSLPDDAQYVCRPTRGSIETGSQEITSCQVKHSHMPTVYDRHHYPCIPSPPRLTSAKAESTSVTADSKSETKHSRQFVSRLRTYNKQATKSERVPFSVEPQNCSPRAVPVHQKSEQYDIRGATAENLCRNESPPKGRVSVLRRLYSNHNVKSCRCPKHQSCLWISSPLPPDNNTHAVDTSTCAYHTECEYSPKTKLSRLRKTFSNYSVRDEKLPFPEYPYLPCPHCPPVHDFVGRETHKRPHLHSASPGSHLSRECKEPKLSYSCTEVKCTRGETRHSNSAKDSCPLCQTRNSSSSRPSLEPRKTDESHRRLRYPNACATSQNIKQDSYNGRERHCSFCSADRERGRTARDNQRRKFAKENVFCPCPCCAERSHYVRCAHQSDTQGADALPDRDFKAHMKYYTCDSDKSMMPSPWYPYNPRPSSPLVPASLCMDIDLQSSNLEWDYKHPPERKVSDLRRYFTRQSKAAKKKTVLRNFHGSSFGAQTSSQQPPVAYPGTSSEHLMAPELLLNEKPRMSVDEKHVDMPDRPRAAVADLRGALLKQGVKLTGRLLPFPYKRSHLTRPESHSIDSPEESGIQTHLGASGKRKSLTERLSAFFSPIMSRKSLKLSAAELNAAQQPTEEVGEDTLAPSQNLHMVADPALFPTKRNVRMLEAQETDERDRRHSSGRQSVTPSGYSRTGNLIDSKRYSCVRQSDSARKYSKRESVPHQKHSIDTNAVPWKQPAAADITPATAHGQHGNPRFSEHPSDTGRPKAESIVPLEESSKHGHIASTDIEGNMRKNSTQKEQDLSRMHSSSIDHGRRRPSHSGELESLRRHTQDNDFQKQSFSTRMSLLARTSNTSIEGRRRSSHEFESDLVRDDSDDEVSD